MTEHRFMFNDQEADLLAEVISNSLRGIPMTFTAEHRAYLIVLKNSLEQRKTGRRAQTAFVEEAPITRLGGPS